MHRIPLARTVGAALAFSLCSAAASAVVVTFDPLTNSTTAVLPGGHEEAGFQFAPDAGSTLLVFGSTNPSYTGSAAIALAGGRYPGMTLNKLDGSAFTLHSIDLSEWASEAPFEVVFTGYFSDPIHGGFGGFGFWTQGVFVDGAFGNQTFNFGSYFNDVVYVEIASRSGQRFQFDNVVLGPPANEVPEPGSIGLVALGLVGLAARRRHAARSRRDLRHPALAA